VVQQGDDSTAPETVRKKILLIGWDAADWKMIHPLIEQGAMPTLKALMDEGVWGNIATLNPILSPMLWTSIATGKRPYKHGIHGFTEPLPDGKGIRPSSSTTRTCKAIWNILTQKDYRTHQVGWFCSHPAEPINGAYVTNLYDRVTTQKPEDWKLPDESVYPGDLADTMANLRIHPTELVAEQILPFIPNAAKIDQDKDHRLAVFAKLMCEMVNIHSAATWVMENRPWDFMGVYNPAIDHFCHAFMKYNPPKIDQVCDEDFEIYKDVVVGVYRFHDLMLHRMLELAGEDSTVVLCSDHGFHSDHLRPRGTPREPAGPAVWHREYGILIMKGPGIKKGDRVYGASLLDVTPTILTLYGLPVANDMDGKPLVQALEDQDVWLPRIESWENVEGEAGMHPRDKRENPFEAREAVQQLVDLGYIDKPDANAERAAEQTKQEAKYNLACAYLDGGQLDDATSLLEDMVAAAPQQMRFALQLARCYIEQRRRPDARWVIEQILDGAQKQAEQGVESLERRRKMLHKRVEWQKKEEVAISDGRAAPLPMSKPENAERKTGVDQQGAQDGGSDPPPRHMLRITPQMLERAERRIDMQQDRLRHLDVRVTPQALLLLGELEYAERHDKQALAHLREAEKTEPRLPGLHIQIGRVYRRSRRWEDARRAFRKALDIDGDSAVAHDGLASALLRLGKPTEAAEHSLIAVGLLHHFPGAHHRLGIALTRLHMYERAIEAFETTLKIAPMSVEPHRWLERIYRQQLNRPDLAAEHHNKIEFIRKTRKRRVDKAKA